MVKEGKEPKIKGNSLGASGFTLGIVAFISLGWFGIFLSIIGFLFCLFQQKKKPTKLGKVGIIINVISFVFSIVFIVYLAPLITQWIAQQSSMFPVT